MTALDTAGEIGGRIAGGALGGVLGGMIGGPVGAWIGRYAGSKLGAMAGKAAAAALANAMEKADEDAEANTKAEAKAKAETCGSCKQKDPCEHLRRGNGKGKHRGGAHGETTKPKGDQQDSHHMPPKQCFPKSMWNDLPAIQMDPADHALTMSNGQNGAAGIKWRAEQCELVNNGKFGEALQREIDDIRRVAGNKYDDAIKEMDEYAKCREKHGLNTTPANPVSPTPVAPGKGPSKPSGPAIS
jgi:hypothetical protein